MTNRPLLQRDHTLLDFELPPRPKIATYEGGPALYVQAKYDGIMLTVYRSPESGVQVYTRHKDPAKGLYTEKVNEARWFAECCRHLDVGHSVMGELWCPGEPASAVKSDPYACEFSVFAMPHLAPSLGLGLLESYVRGMDLEFPEWYEYGTPSAQDFCHDGWDLNDPRKADPNYEGFVFKDGNTLNWAKHKPVLTIDLIVKRCNMSLQGKFLGQYGALTMKTTEGVVVCDAGILEDAVRLAIVPAKDVGRVGEIHYQYVSSQGRLRHPRFVRWRDDKDPSECLLSQDPDLVAHWS